MHPLVFYCGCRPVQLKKKKYFHSNTFVLFSVSNMKKGKERKRGNPFSVATVNTLKERLDLFLMRRFYSGEM